MSKFHINKNGVPAPCRATKGNCPLGGESGNENHFDTQEEAQAHADQVNAKEHGIIEGMPKEHVVIEIDDQAFNGSFPVTYDNNGYTMTGVHKWQLDDAEEEGNEALLELKEQLPEEILNDNDNFTLVPEHNAQDFFEAHVVSADTEEGSIENYRAMTATVKEYDPELIREHMSEDAIDRDFEVEIATYAKEQEFKNSNITINGQKVIMSKYEDRNWAKDYIESLKEK